MSLLQQHSLDRQNTRWQVFCQDLEFFASYCLAHLIVWRNLLTATRTRDILNSAGQAGNERRDGTRES